MAKPAPRVDRDEVFLEYTKSICPMCKVVVDAEVHIRAGQVVLSKRCRQHGFFEALLSPDAKGCMAALRYNKPGTIPLATQTDVGLPGVLRRLGSSAQPLHVDDGPIEVALDAFVEAEGEPEVVMFSGGEPTIHPQILDAMRMAYAKGVRNVTLNTNGIRLAHDRRFMKALAAMADEPPGIYLQFDGLWPDTHLAVRGRDLRAAKQSVLDACAEEGLIVTLAAAIEPGGSTTTRSATSSASASSTRRCGRWRFSR